MNILGVIGARSGSKSIPHKNIKPLLGKPLLAWIIEAGKRSRYLSRLVLSTDSSEYTEIGERYGAEAPFLRPAELAEDTAPDIGYLQHAAAWLAKNENWKADIIVRLIPTTPLCKTASIDACIKLLLDDDQATSSRTITSVPKHPYKLWKIDGETLIPFIPKESTGMVEPSNVSRHLLPPVYAHVDVIAVRYNTLMRDGLLTGERIRYHQIQKSEAVDIDNENDFLLAEILLKKRLETV